MNLTYKDVPANKKEVSREKYLEVQDIITLQPNRVTNTETQLNISCCCAMIWHGITTARPDQEGNQEWASA